MIVKEVKSEHEAERVLVFTRINLYDSLRFLLVIAQFFGVMPLHGLGKDYYKVNFKWGSLRVAYAIANVLGSFISALFWVAKFFNEGLYVYQTDILRVRSSLERLTMLLCYDSIHPLWLPMAYLCFYLCTCCGNILLINLAKHWSQILKEWSHVEMSMRGYNNPTNLKRKFVLLTSVFMGFGVVEHLFFILNGTSKAKKCPHLAHDLFEGFFQISFQNYFSLIPYTAWIAVIVKFFNTISTFTWIFVDLLVALMSITLTARYRQIVTRLSSSKVKNEKFWKEIRQDYQRLHLVYQKIDKHFSAIVLVSYVQNIYFLCIQLYNSLKDRTGIIESVYFFYSFGFLVMRLVAVSLYCAWLYDEARRPLEFLHTVPAENYSKEVKLLIDQICTTPIVVSGMGFFLVTKKFLLQIAGTIVTFELMIFQFAPIKNGQGATECDVATF